MLRILGGTRREDEPPLCHTCRFAVIAQGQAPSQRLVRCNYLARVVPFPVFECSTYADKRHASLDEMETIAWVIRTKNINRPAGFAAGKPNELEVTIEQPDPRKGQAVPSSQIDKETK